MKYTTFVFMVFLSVYVCTTVSSRRNIIFALNEKWVCGIKKSCVDCLRLTQCSWCKTENRCFSAELSSSNCENAITTNNYGLGLELNSQCTCAEGQMEKYCYPPGVSEGPECSGQGNCICGRCVCNPQPDPQQPTKNHMGDFCEYDNYSCVGHRCREGPYSLAHPYGKDDEDQMTPLD